MPRHLSWEYEIASAGHSKGGHTVTEITMQHTQLEHHLMERVDALSAKLAEFVRSYRSPKSQSEEATANLVVIEGQVGIGKQREREHGREQ